MNHRQFHLLSALQIPFAILIVLWGAWVRISGSGDGCGTHWPLCQGVLMPTSEFQFTLQTWIEYFHRAKSGIFGIFGLLQFVFAFKLYTKGSAVRFFSFGSFAFLIIEALLGALLVLGGFVDKDVSNGRIVVMSLHLVNTLLLLTFLFGTYYFSKPIHVDFKTSKLRNQIWDQKWLLYSLLVLLIVAVAGAWAALSTTLFPSATLTEGLLKDLDPKSHLILKIRMLHPFFATIGSFLIFFLTWPVQNELKKFSVTVLTISQLLFGISTLALLSPIWMKITHLLLADCLWLAVVSLFFLRVTIGTNKTTKL